MRLVPLAGPANFRDLGGYENCHGARVRTGRVFRSDSLSHMTDEDVAHVVEVLGLRTVIDLRAGNEVDEFSHGPLEAVGVTFHHLPVLDETRRRPPDESEVDVERMTLDQIYLLMIERFADRFTRVLRIIADADQQPLVFHCAAGKDRTGITAALVLGLLDVDDEVIAADYALSAEAMPVLIERHRRRAEQLGVQPEVVDQVFVPEAHVMRQLLRDIRERFGSIEGYVRSGGLSAAEVAALRDSLLE